MAKHIGLPAFNGLGHSEFLSDSSCGRKSRVFTCRPYGYTRLGLSLFTVHAKHSGGAADSTHLPDSSFSPGGSSLPFFPDLGDPFSKSFITNLAPPFLNQSRCEPYSGYVKSFFLFPCRVYDFPFLSRRRPHPPFPCLGLKALTFSSLLRCFVCYPSNDSFSSCALPSPPTDGLRITC